MLDDLYLLSALPRLEADLRRNFQHHAPTISEMAASCKLPKGTASPAGKRIGASVKGFLLTLLGGNRA